MHGCVTAFLGVVCLSFSASEAFRIFGRMCTVVAFSGGFFGLFVLPVILVLLSKLYGKWATIMEQLGGNKPVLNGMGMDENKEGRVIKTSLKVITSGSRVHPS